MLEAIPPLVIYIVKLLLFAGFLYFLWRLYTAKRRFYNKNGIVVTAHINTISYAGYNINQLPVYDLTLSYQYENVSYRITYRKRFLPDEIPEADSDINILLHPKDPKKIMLKDFALIK